jgi:hypothetical protein
MNLFYLILHVSPSKQIPLDAVYRQIRAFQVLKHAMTQCEMYMFN